MLLSIQGTTEEEQRQVHGWLLISLFEKFMLCITQYIYKADLEKIYSIKRLLLVQAEG